MAFIVCAAIGLGHVWNSGQADRAIDRNWLLAMLIICCALTLTAGVSFGAGSRYRVPLEPIVPLLAGVGLVRLATLLYANRREESGGSNPFQVQDIG